MKILIFSIAYEPLVGGAELAVRNITDRFPPSSASRRTMADPPEALAEAGSFFNSYEFDLITCRFSREHKKFEKIGNVNVYRVGFGNRIGRLLYPVLASRLAKKLHREKPYQIVWSIMAAYAGAASLLFLRHFPAVKFLLTLQEGDAIAHVHGRVRGFKKSWQRIFRRADRIQAISKFLAQWARDEGAVGPIDIVPNGVDIKNFQFSIFNFQSNSKEQNSKFTIITASRLVPKNGIDILIRAVSKLPATSYQLQILGTGAEEAKLKNLAAELKITDRVQFLGNISQEDLPKYLARADIFVRPSRSEGLGTAFLEAMAAGLPIIGTPVGGIPDFLHDGETGLFSIAQDPADLAEKIRSLIQNENLRRQLAARGRTLVEKTYDWNIIAAQMSEIFKNLI